MESSTLSAGSLLKHGEYKITGMLGQGGFGITYEAEQVSLGRKVAVKEFFMKDLCNRDESTSHVSVPSVGSKELVERFRQKFIREARTIAALDHNHIVRIYDVFEENGTAYYVMEYLSGGSLDRKIRECGALSEEKAVGYIRQIADALHYLHSRSILHFDVKPSNVLLNENGIAKLIDFGISKHYDESGSQTSSTPVGISKGFAPLEQYQQGGDIKTFTPATDIYALGATLYALVAGSNPPEASVVNEDGVPSIKGVSDSVKSAIESAMQPKRKDRPQSVREFLNLLDGGNSHFEEEVSGETTVINDKSKQMIAHQSSSGYENGHEWVDLGLSVKWASCNVGASSPSEYGEYFAWGETSPKNCYIDETLKYHYNGWFIAHKFSKYVTEHRYGKVDNKVTLELRDDAANFNWGGRWRMPTKTELDELREKCIWTLTTQSGHEGYKVTSKSTGNSIFLPAAGYRNGSFLDRVGFSGSYWSSSLDMVLGNNCACVLCIHLDRVLCFNPGHVFCSRTFRSFGQSVRPVCP